MLYFCLGGLAEGPLGGDGGDGVEAIVVAVAVVDEVVAQLHLGAKRQFDLFPPLDGVEVEPELRLAERDEFAADVGVTPHIQEAGEGAQSAAPEGRAPHCCELEAVEAVYAPVAILEVALVHRLEG